MRCDGGVVEHGGIAVNGRVNGGGASIGLCRGVNDAKNVADALLSPLLVHGAERTVQLDGGRNDVGGTLGNEIAECEDGRSERVAEARDDLL